MPQIRFSKNTMITQNQFSLYAVFNFLPSSLSSLSPVREKKEQSMNKSLEPFSYSTTLPYQIPVPSKY